MANIKSINGNPIVLDSNGLAEKAVTSAKLADELADSLDRLYEMGGLELITGWQSGYISDATGANIADAVGSPVANANWQYVVLDCSGGDKFLITASKGSNPYPYVFTDASYNVLSRRNVAVTKERATAPAAAKKLVLNRMVNGTGKVTDECYRGERISDAVAEEDASIAKYAEASGCEIILGWSTGAIAADANNNLAASIALPITTTSLEYVVVPCNPGDTFTVTGKSGTTPKAAYFADSGYDVIVTVGYSDIVDRIMVAPSGSAYLVINRGTGADARRDSYKGVPHWLRDEGVGQLLPDATDMNWSWWHYPHAVSFNGARDRLYFGYTSNNGLGGIAAYDFRTGRTVRKHLKRSNVDSHNSTAVHVLSDGTIICAYSLGHAEDVLMHVWRSKIPESIEEWEPEVTLGCGSSTTYCQLVESDGRLFMFYRCPTTQWRYRYSDDEGLTWSDEVIAITSSVQYYCRFVPTTTDGIIRIVMYSHPTTGDSNIRMGFLHADTRKMYNADGTTELGTSSVQNTAFDIVVPTDATLIRNRLYDCPVTAPENVLINYAVYGYTANPSEYRVYDNGTVTTVCAGGAPLGDGSYPLGMMWLNDHQLVVARGSGTGGGTDLVELYDYADGAVTLSEVLHSELRGSYPVRNFYPVCDVNGRAAIWLRGWHSDVEPYYNDLRTDVMVHDFEGGE